MSEDLKRQLAQRLDAKKRRIIESQSVPQLSLQKTKSKALLPNLSGLPSRFTLGVPKPSKLDPISRFIQTGSIPQGQVSQAIIEDQPPPSQTLKSKFLPPLSFPKQKKPHYHGKEKLLEDKEKTEYHKPYEFIQVIKNDPELMEDFWYCNRDGDAYDFQLVPFNKKNEEYLTISSRGITHFTKGGGAYFLSLEEWEREYKLYQRLKEISFFKQYKKWKNFSLWKNSRRKKMMNERAKFLESELFILDEKLREPLLNIRVKNWELLKYDFIDITYDKVWTLEEFNIEMEQKKGRRSDELEVLESLIKREVETSCIRSLEAFRRENKSTANNDDQNRSPEEDPGPLLVGDMSGKLMPHTQEAIIRTHYKRLAKFVRLVDYLIIDAKIILSYQSNIKIKDTIKFDYNIKEKKSLLRRQHQPLFVIECTFSGRELYFEPTNESINKAIYDAIIRGLTVLLNNYMLLSSEDFAKYRAALEEYEEKQNDEEFDLLQMVINDEPLKVIQEEAKTGINFAFQKLKEYSNKFLPYIEMYHRNSRLKVENLIHEDIEDIKELILDYKKQEEDLRSLKDVEDFGIFQLNIERMKSVIMPSPTQCLKKIESFLPKIALESATNLTQALNEANKNLKGNPRKVDDYVSQTKHLKDIEDRLPDITNKVNDLKDLMQLLDQFSIRFEDHIKRKYNETLTSLDALRQRIQSIHERMEGDNIRFTRELRDKIIQVDKRTSELKEKLKNEDFANKDSKPEAVVPVLASIQEEVNTLIADTKAYNYYLTELGSEPKNFMEAIEMQKDFTRKYEMWKALLEWEDKVVSWNDTTFSVIDVAKISQEVDMYYKTAKKSKVLEEQGNYVPQVLKAKVETLKDTMPVVVDLRCESLQERHWKDIRKELEVELDINDPKFTLKKLLEMKVNNKKDKIAEIALRARKEEEIEAQLEIVNNSWKDEIFTVKQDRSDDFYFISDVENIVSKLEETQVTLTTLLTNRFLGPLFEKVDTCSKKFKLFAATLDELLLCQKQWSELHKIFKGGDLAKKLKDKNKNFLKYDAVFRELMKKINNFPEALPACTKPGTLESLQNWNQNFEKLQKQLEEYLDKQRLVFPRFFFLSNEELLMILSNSQNSKNIQSFLKNMFEGIYSLEIDEDKSDQVTHIVSAENEKVDIPKGTKTKSMVEDWLHHLELSMIQSLKTKLTEANLGYPDSNRKDLINIFPCQIVLVWAMINWVSATEDALSSKDTVLESLGDLYEQTNTYLEELSQMVRENLDLVQRRKVVALVTQDVHNREVLDKLKDEEVASVNDFKWQQQLRYYWNSTDHCHVKQVNADFPYGYEYMGATTRLVITALTDRCWMTITGALSINLGAAPAGPAGTGKTESTKDLAKAMGRYCIVFNCSEQITFMMMEKLFMGLCFTGSWSCLDEFNRIDIEVLSVIAQQLRTIKHAKDDSKSEFFFEDKKISLNIQMGVFITMNPNYVGRTELPDNLKVLFRPISMMIPDYTLIAEVMLYAEGFSQAKELSGKMTNLYKLASEQLSQQDHYDFGMRAVKSVLNMAGSLKRKEPSLKEEAILIRAMKDSNVPKFLKEDLVLFNAIIGDLFPDTEIKSPDYGELESSLREVIRKEDLIPVESFINKVIQLFETLEVRFGTMIVGPATSGKSTCYRCLAKTLTDLRTRESRNPSFQKVQFQVLNPKAITMGELYGEYNATNEWKDGLASSIIREYCKKEDMSRRWVVFDGPVDSLWIENMNTVLDDNMMLCLANQERIKLKPEMRMLFEVGDLTSASPATVSRCGMLYMNIEAVGWKAVLDSQIKQVMQGWSDKAVDHMMQLIHLYFAKAISVVRKGSLFEPIPTTNNSLVTSFCNLLKAVTLPEFCPRMNDSFEYLKKFLDKIFVFCITWGIAGGLDYNSQQRFDSGISSELGVDLPKGPLFESFVNSAKVGGEYKPWDQIKPDFKYVPNTSYFKLLVPTMDTVRFQEILRYAISIQKPVFITGNTGVGKSVIINDSLMNFKETNRISSIFLTFSAQTTSKQTQNSIVSKLNPIKKDVLGGHGNNRIALMIDDVNMPTLEKYGAQPPIELLRHLSDHNCIYELDKKFPMKIIDTTLICCAAPPGGGRSVLTQRFTRHFHMVVIPDTTEETMKVIFRTILEKFYANGFKQDILNQASFVVSATITVYQILKAELLPTPSKSHYLFNLRDVSKVFQGMLMARPIHMQNQESVVKMWIHETSKVFYDRLINQQDKDWLSDILLKMIPQYFKLTYTKEELFGEVPILYADFMKGDLDMDEREYILVPDLNILKRCINEFLVDYNASNSKQMDLVFFNDAMEHLTRICRILRQQRGNCMLIGVGGCGKQSLTRLAGFMCRCECFQIQVTKDYNLKAFRDDLRKLFLYTGGTTPKPGLFLITDTQIVSESFLEDVNSILNSGEVPNLFEKADWDNVESDLRPLAEKEGVTDTIMNYFMQRVRNNLHIVICMSPIGDALRVRMRMFPSLVNCCTINWVDPWPQDALLSVGKNKLLDIPLESYPKPKLAQFRETLSQMLVFVHQSVIELSQEFSQVLNRKVYVTPKSYLDVISCYFKILEEKQEELNSAIHRYKLGISQLAKTNQEVSEMQVTLKALKPELEKKVVEIREMQKTVEQDTLNASKAKEMVEDEEREVNTKAQEIRVLQEEAENDLKEAMPLLESATKALLAINKQDIAEVKRISNPTELVALTLESVAILMEVPTNLESVKKLLNTNNFLENLINFPKDNIKPVTLRKLRNKISSNPNFTPEKMDSASQACKCLCQWVIAIDNYANISKKVEPKKKHLEEMNKFYADAMGKLKETQDRLNAQMARVQDLEFKLKKTSDEQVRLENEISQTETRLKRASVLTDGLKDEYQRWQIALNRLSEQVKDVAGNTFIAAACVSYYGPFTGSYRSKLVNQWLAKCQELEITISSNFELQEILGDPIQIREWQLFQLPSDSISINNAIIITRSERWPLLIDPQEQANKWIRKMEEEKGLKVVKANEKDLSKNLELCIREGYPLLIEDVGESLNPILDPVLSKNLVEQIPGHFTLRIGDNDLDYDKKFQLYMTTKLSNPHYLPEVSIKVSLINFTVTMQGLEEQLLALVVRREEPKIEEDQNKTIKDISDGQRDLRAIEQSILTSLTSTQGNVLDDEKLIIKLESSKNFSNTINKRMATSEKNKEQNEIAREKYKSVARRGSILYFVIADLVNIDPMYQFSLSYFTKLFNLILLSAQHSNDLAERIEILVKSVTETIYSNVCRGLFNSHKIIFSFLIVAQILKAKGEITEPEWGFLLKGPSLNLSAFKKTANPGFSQKVWDSLIYLQGTSKVFEKVCDEISNNFEIWAQYSNSKDPHLEDPPSPFETISHFHRLLLIKVFREEKIIYGIQNFILNSLGQKFVKNLPVSMDELYSETTKRTPIIFVLSPGADPMAMVQRLANDKKFHDRMDAISLGKGQDLKAKMAIEKGVKEGRWVIMQNCHLAKSFMPELDKIIEAFDEPKSNIHDEFRLFLTSMPCSYFPIPILQNGVKLTIEPAKGIQSNLLRSLNSLKEDQFQSSSKPEVLGKIIFSLCVFHAVLQERRKFGALGWNFRYEFNESDLETSIKIIENFINEQELTPWEAINFIVGEINYGGRVTDDHDRRCLSYILGAFIKPEIMNTDFHYMDTSTYFIPEDLTLPNLKLYANSLPLADDPDIFGMHENANITYQKNESFFIVDTILSIQPKEKGTDSSGKSSDQVVDELATKFLEELPNLLMRSEERVAIFVEDSNGLMNAMATFLSQEMERFNRLLIRIKSSLENLKKAIKGLVLMSDDLDKTYTSINENRVPVLWGKVAYPSLKPLASWLADLKERVKFLREWLATGKPDAYWLSAFFFPQGFLTSVLQMHARQYKDPIDTLSFSVYYEESSQVRALKKKQEEQSQNNNSVYVYGLYTEGCRWDFDVMQLDEARPGEMYATAPIIQFVPSEKGQTEEGEVSMPIYKTSERAGVLSTTGHSTNYIISIDCPCSKTPAHWILRGGAFLCQLND